MKNWLFCLILPFLFSCNGNKVIKWWVSSENKHWEEQRNIIWDPIEVDTAAIDIQIYLENALQEINGFGGCVNELGYKALLSLPENKREEILHNIFSKNGDLHFNFCRMPVGANDYSLGYYSLNDSVNDYSMEFFSIERDRQCLIPYIKDILDINDDIKIWASPWTPPVWMKTNKHYACAAGKNNDLSVNAQGKEGENMFLDNDTMLRAYASYLIKFVKEYDEAGIKIAQLHVQNEFNSCQTFPSCTWEPNLLSTFIGRYLGPRFEKNKMKTEIWLGTFERPNCSIIDSIMLKNNASKFIKGIGIQWAGKVAVADVHKKYPELPLMQTETECGSGANSWANAEYTFSLMKKYFDAGVNSYMAWNMVLDTSGLSSWGWKQNALISIDTIAKNYRLNHEYWLFKHFSNLIEPGSHLVKCQSYGFPALAFLTPDNDLVLILHNNTDNKISKRVKVAGKTFEIKMVPHSFNSLLCYNIQ